jgi:hypothetical protein
MVIGYLNLEAVRQANDTANEKDKKESDAGSKLSTEASTLGSAPISPALENTTQLLPSLEILEQPAANRNVDSAETREDFTGRPESESINRVGDRLNHFEPLTAEQLQQSKELVERDLKFFKTGDGNNVLDKLYSTLSSHDSELVIKMMAEVRENYARQTKDGVISPEQKGSWLHSIGEMAEVIDVAKIHGLNERQTRNAIIAALFSDSVKSGWSESTGGNFFTHHLDGARAADMAIDRHNGYNGFLDSWEGNNFEEIDRQEIRHAILEHQIGPPKFMGFAYSKEIADRLNSERQKEHALLKEKWMEKEPMSARELLRFDELALLSKTYDDRNKQLQDLKNKQSNQTELPTLERDYEIQELEKLQRRGRFVHAGEAYKIDLIEKAIGDPLNSPLENDPRGGKRLQFDHEQRELLRKYVGSGAQYWHVPHPDTPWAKVSQTLRTADSLDNYFGQVDQTGKPAKGPFKIAALRGPISITPDRDIFETIDAIQASEDGAKLLMNADERKVADERSKQSAVVYKEALASTEQFIRQRLNIPEGRELPSIPFWNDKLTLPETNAPEVAKAFSEKPEVKFAREIHQHFCSELLRVRQVNQSATFPEVRSVTAKDNARSGSIQRPDALRTLTESVGMLLKPAEIEAFAERISNHSGVPKEEIVKRITEMRASTDPAIVQLAEKLVASESQGATGTDQAKRTVDVLVKKGLPTLDLSGTTGTKPIDVNATTDKVPFIVAAKPVEETHAGKNSRSVRAGVGLGVGLGVTLGAGLQWLKSGNSQPAPIKDQKPTVEKVINK